MREELKDQQENTGLINLETLPQIQLSTYQLERDDDTHAYITGLWLRVLASRNVR